MFNVFCFSQDHEEPDQEEEGKEARGSRKWPSTPVRPRSWTAAIAATATTAAAAAAIPGQRSGKREEQEEKSSNHFYRKTDLRTGKAVRD